jgi:hypothetical protein
MSHTGGEPPGAAVQQCMTSSTLLFVGVNVTPGASFTPTKGAVRHADASYPLHFATSGEDVEAWAAPRNFWVSLRRTSRFFS